MDEQIPAEDPSRHVSQITIDDIRRSRHLSDNGFSPMRISLPDSTGNGHRPSAEEVSNAMVDSAIAITEALLREIAIALKRNATLDSETIRDGDIHGVDEKET